jgi:hypothetical protein
LGIVKWEPLGGNWMKTCGGAGRGVNVGVGGTRVGDGGAICVGVGAEGCVGPGVGDGPGVGGPEGVAVTMITHGVAVGAAVGAGPPPISQAVASIATSTMIPMKRSRVGMFSSLSWGPGTRFFQRNGFPVYQVKSRSNVMGWSNPVRDVLQLPLMARPSPDNVSMKLYVSEGAWAVGLCTNR